MAAVKNRLRVYRHGLGLTQAELAEQVGVSRQTINAVENGKYNPSLELALKISRLMDAPVRKIFYLGENG